MAQSIQLRLKIEDKARISLKDFLFNIKEEPMIADPVTKGNNIDLFW